jgi:hypothetical protein
MAIKYSMLMQNFQTDADRLRFKKCAKSKGDTRRLDDDFWEQPPPKQSETS